MYSTLEIIVERNNEDPNVYRDICIDFGREQRL